ncbi:hypothetical protein Q3G72_031134 [Acer saccharum]|nr:hypothetical protein Q3G72_031134 [Acer saccharum]
MWRFAWIVELPYSASFLVSTPPGWALAIRLKLLHRGEDDDGQEYMKDQMGLEDDDQLEGPEDGDDVEYQENDDDDDDDDDDENKFS